MPLQEIVHKKSAYHFPTGPTHESPCMMDYWMKRPIRQGISRDEIEHGEISEEPEEGDE